MNKEEKRLLNEEKKEVKENKAVLKDKYNKKTLEIFALTSSNGFVKDGHNYSLELIAWSDTDGLITIEKRTLEQTMTEKDFSELNREITGNQIVKLKVQGSLDAISPKSFLLVKILETNAKHVGLQGIRDNNLEFQNS